MGRNRSRRRGSQRASVNPSQPAETPEASSSLSLHQGAAIWKFANTYPSLPLTLVEMIQNAIDAEAEHVFIGIDLKARRVITADDGSGVDKTKFNEALASVGFGIKSKHKLGRFGLGLISPLNKCTRFTFTSKVDRKPPMRWTFTGSEIRVERSEVLVPSEQIKEMPQIARAFRDYLTTPFDCRWKTIVQMEGVTKDKAISLVDLDALEGLVRSKLGIAMRQHGVAVRVALRDENGVVDVRNIDPVTFAGEPFEKLDYAEPDGAGMVEIALYRAPKHGGKRSGEVLIMEHDSDYPVTVNEVARQFRASSYGDMVEDVLRVLGSGFFEGTIRCDKITLAPERTKFEFNDSLVELFMLLQDSWYEQHGRKQFEDEQERSRERRYQRLGLESQERLRQFMPPSIWRQLRASVTYGRLGDGHVDPAKGRPTRFDEEPSLRTGQGGAGTPKTPRPESPEPRERQKPPVDRPGDMPTGSLGPSGRERQLVRGDSEGLWFEYSPLHANIHLWEFDLEQGVITFNTKHPVWVMLDETKGRHLPKNEKQIMDLQEWLALQILSLLIVHPDPEEFEQNRAFIDEQVKPYAEMFILNKRR